MAFGKKYYSSYKSNNNLDYYLEIFVEDYSSTSSELTIGAGGPVIEYETDQEDRFSPIISSSCKIPFLVKDNTDATFIDSLRTTYQERQIYVHLYRSDSSGYSSVSPLWSGFLVMDLGKGVDKSFPYVQELKFVDGLALLKDIDFVDLSNPTYEDRVQGNYVQENMYYGPGTYIFWLREILLKSGAALTTQGATENYRFTTSVNWYNGDMDSAGQSDDPLQKTKCQVSMFHRKDDKDVYFPDNCYNVLKELLRHWGARITYWKHQFWIVQIPEYITGESGTLDNPQNNNSRVYTYTGSLQGTQDHLGSTYWTRYFQEISNTKISKLTGTTYDYLPILKQVNADFLSFASENKFGGLPFGATAPTQEVFQGTINTPSAADFLFLSIPLDWQWDLSNAPNFPNGHSAGWWASIKFNFYASDGSTTYYLQYNSSSQTLPYYWVDSANWQPLGNRSPKYTISSKQITVNGHVGFEEQIPFQDENGNPIVMSGAWSFFLDIEDYGTSSSNPGSFYLNISPSSQFARMRNPGTAIQVPPGSGNMSGTVSWSNSLQDPQGIITISAIQNPAGFNAGTVANDIRFATTSPFLGLLQLMTNTQSAAFGESYNTMNTSSTAAQENSEQFDFGTLLWGDVTDEFARSSLQVYDGSTYENTNQSGLWGRGTLLGTKTFTQLLIDEFLYGQTKIVITPNMRLAVGEANKDQTQGSVTRPRYVNPIGKLRETRDGADPEYFFRRGSFHTLLDEWDYEGYQILRNVVTTTTQTNGMGNRGGTQANTPNQQAMIQNPVVQALAQNSPIAYLRETVNATGSDVAVNGNFNVATGWTLGTGWTIDTTEKVAKFAATGSTSDLVQSVLTQELTYQVNFRVVVTAGTLTVKAGTSGDTQVISSSGDYSIYLTCEGSNDIKFQAGATFTGNITFITLRDQKSLTSLPIEEIGSAVFKTGDTFNLINENEDQPLVLTVTADQGSTDTTISVSSTPLYEDITPNSYLLINQDDLSAQYQNKTKGTVGGFDITANSIDSGSVSIQSYIDDDSFGTASATSLATSESIKAYVDTQVGSSDTLQEVTDNGATTTNAITFAGGTSTGDITGQSITLGDGSTDEKLRVYYSDNSYIDLHGYGLYLNRSFSYIRPNSNNTISLLIGSSSQNFSNIRNYAVTHNWFDASSELMRLNSTGLGIGTSSPSEKLHIAGGGSGNLRLDSGGTYYGTYLQAISSLGIKIGNDDYSAFTQIHNDGYQLWNTGGSEKMRLTSDGYLGINNSSPATNLHVGTGSGGSIDSSYQIGVDGSAISGIQILSGSSQSGRIVFGDSNNTSIGMLRYEHSDNSMRFRVNGSERARITSGGNLLIGRTTDDGSSKLQVNGKGYFNGNVIIENNKELRWKDSSGNERTILELTNANDLYFGGSFAGSLIFIGGGSYTERARISDSGNFLIGTTTDSAKLTVDETTTNNLTVAHFKHNQGGVISNLLLENSAGANDTGFSFDFRLASSGTSAKIGAIRTNSPSAGDTDMFFSTSTNGTSVSEAMRITSSSNVLIGTTTDDGSSKLQVEGNVKVGDGYLLSAGSGLDLRLKHDGTDSFIFNETGDLYIQNKVDDKDIIFQCDDGTGGLADYIRLDGSQTTVNIYQNTLIGTTTDAGYKLDVSGSFRASQESTFASNLLFPDNARIKLGNSNDLQIYHNGTNTIMTNGTGEFRIIQSKSDADLVLMCDDGTGGETAYLTLDGSQTTINLQQNVLIGTTSNSGGKLYVNSTTTDRVARFESSDSLAYLQVNDNQDSLYISTENQIGSFGGLTGSNSINFNISLTSGNAALGGTPSAVYKLDVVGKQRVQSVLELEDVLTLNAISTPSDPANNKSSIYMDSADGSIKVKINVEGTVVTRTLASFE